MLDDTEDRVEHGGELPKDNEDNPNASNSLKRDYGFDTPSNYIIGDIYIKLELAKEVKELEDKINDSFQQPEERLSILKQAKNNYEKRIDQIIRDYKKSEDDFNKVRSDLKDLEEGLQENKKVVPFDLHADIRIRRDIERKNAVEEMYKKALHENYTKMVMLSFYTSRVAVEIEKTEYGQPTQKFRILNDDDQLV